MINLSRWRSERRRLPKRVVFYQWGDQKNKQTGSVQQHGKPVQPSRLIKLDLWECCARYLFVSKRATPFTPQSSSTPSGSPRQDDELVTTTKGQHVAFGCCEGGGQADWLAGWPAGHTWTLLHNLLTQPRTTSPANDQQRVDCRAVRTSGTPELTFFFLFFFFQVTSQTGY